MGRAKAAVTETETLPTVIEPAGALAVADYSDDSGRGFENESASDFALPFISLLQALSPEVTEEDSDLKAGQLYNTITGEAVSGKEGMEFVISSVQHVVVEWIPREQGGGLVSVHPFNHPAYLEAKAVTGRDFGKFSTAYDKDSQPCGNDLIETYYLYGVVVENGEPAYMAVISLKSTYIGPFRKYNTQIKTFVPKGADGKVIVDKAGRPIRIPRFAHLVKITTTQETRTKGTSYNFVFSPANGSVAASLLPRTDSRYLAARECLELVEKGRARAAIETDGESTATDDKIPF